MQVQQRLCEIRGQLPANPFDALAAALCVADELAHDVAPRACSAEGWSRRQPFAFRGHAALKREVHWLYRARCTVKALLGKDARLLQSPEREVV